MHNSKHCAFISYKDAWYVSWMEAVSRAVFQSPGFSIALFQSRTAIPQYCLAQCCVAYLFLSVHCFKCWNKKSTIKIKENKSHKAMHKKLAWLQCQIQIKQINKQTNMPFTPLEQTKESKNYMVVKKIIVSLLHCKNKAFNICSL